MPSLSRTDLPITLLYDGRCSLCSSEIRFMQRIDTTGSTIHALDIAAPDFNPADHNLTHADVMARIHALLPDGRVLTGMAVFRHAYAALGLGWLTAPTGWPVFKPLFDRFYDWFARNRLRLAGRCPT